ncbi:MAG: winged helix-turn-helix transcriptional regulator [Bosea sp.]|jgi:DNA-binding MarR family transcriptional regulator|nr:winged helix-turn-helix transcriptional regulator [Bosea sp. (in: a-proteobacteria)]
MQDRSNGNATLSGQDAEQSGQSGQMPWDLPRFRNWIAVANVHLLVEKAMAAGLVPLSLKLPHYDILANVYRFPGLTQQELANRLLVGRSNLSMLLPELERRGLVRRVPDRDDRRVRRLNLSPEGRILTLRALKVQVQVIENMMAALSAEECATLGDFMRRVGQHMLAHPLPPDGAGPSPWDGR